MRYFDFNIIFYTHIIVVSIYAPGLFNICIINQIGEAVSIRRFLSILMPGGKHPNQPGCPC